MTHYHEVLQELREPTKELRATMPDAWQGFLDLHRGAMAEGAVPTRVKEAAALAMGVLNRCDGCIAHHAKAAARAGATADEIAEMLGVSLLMGGGSASVWAPRAWEAYNEFVREAQHA